MPFTIDRVLVTASRPEALATSDRLAALLRARPADRPLVLTVAMNEATDGARRVLAQMASAHGADRHVEITLEGGAGLAERLGSHGALLPLDDAGRSLIVPAWQRGLCVINSAADAAQAATFADDYVETGEGRPWYSSMEGQPVVITGPQHIRLDYGARINPRAVIHNEGAITIGRGSLLGADAELNLWTATFTMGRFCHTSSYFAAVGSRHTLHRPSTFAVSRGPYAFLGEPADLVGDIAIGNDVWFGTRVVVLPGVRVADGCVVGAGSVVTSSLTEAYGIYAGNPARLIRHRFPPHVVKWLCAIQWWNWPTRTLWERRAFFRTDLTGLSEAELWQLIDPAGI
jgi:acetyltransferase-like isoleucine patch superfamily enzyme